MKRISIEPSRKCDSICTLRYIVLISAIVFLSCNSQPNRQTRNSDLKNFPAQKAHKQENFALSKFIQTGKVNKPKIVKCRRPLVIMDSSGRGVPFFTNYSTDQGLGLNEITSIITDSLGNLWF